MGLDCASFSFSSHVNFRKLYQRRRRESFWRRRNNSIHDQHFNDRRYSTSTLLDFISLLIDSFYRSTYVYSSRKPFTWVSRACRTSSSTSRTRSGRCSSDASGVSSSFSFLHRRLYIRALNPHRTEELTSTSISWWHAMKSLETSFSISIWF